MQLKAVAYSISSHIQSHEKIPWLPMPRNISGSDNLLELVKRLFNLPTWIVSPSAAMDKIRFSNFAKVSEIVQSIQSLVPGSQPGFNQLLLSITTLAKTGRKS